MGATLSTVTYTGGIESYIADSRMEHLGTWGTDVEVIALAHLLKTTIYSYSVENTRWQEAQPRYLDGTLADTTMAMYLRNRPDHWEVIASVSV